MKIVKWKKNPFEKECLFFFGKGAEQFSMMQGLEIVDPNYFFTQKRIDELKRIKLML